MNNYNNNTSYPNYGINNMNMGVGMVNPTMVYYPTNNPPINTGGYVNPKFLNSLNNGKFSNNLNNNFI